MHAATRKNRGRFLAIALVGVAALAGAAGAIADDTQASDSQDRQIASLIADLDHVELGVREAAMEKFRSLDLTPESLLRHASSISELSFEQWTRLDEILRELFIATPRAGLGAGLERSMNPPGVRLSPIIQNFPLAETLQDNDIITSINGVELSGQPVDDTTIRATILSHDPGETLDLRIVRQGRPMRASVKLGRYDELVNAAPLSEQLYTVAWTLRRSRLGFDPPGKPTISTELNRSDWPSFQNVGGLQRLSHGVVPGGGANDGVPSYSRLQIGLEDNGRRSVELRVQQIDGRVDVRRVAPRDINEIRAENIRNFRRQLEEQQRIIRAQQAIIDSPDIDAQERLVARSVLRNALNRAAQLQLVLQRIEQQLD